MAFFIAPQAPLVVTCRGSPAHLPWGLLLRILAYRFQAPARRARAAKDSCGPKACPAQQTRSAEDRFLALTARSYCQFLRPVKGRLDPFAAPFGRDRYLRGAAATDDVTDVFVGENVPLDRPRRRLTALTSRAIGEVNMRNAQSGAPELVARIQTQKRARHAEVEWPTRYAKAKRSRGLMAGLHSGENAKFSCARLARACTPQVGGWRGD
jgi:hypothetical protein